MLVYERIALFKSLLHQMEINTSIKISLDK